MGFLQQFCIPKVQFVLILFLIVLSTLSYYPLLTVARIVIFAIFFTVVSDLLFVYVRKRTLFVPYAAMVTGLILGLTINPHLSWYGIFFISVIASASKHVIQVSHRHIFNPAAIGLVVGNIFLRDTVSWWGVSFQVLKLAPLNIVAFLMLVLPFCVSGIRMKRFGGIGSFLLTYSVLLFLAKSRLTACDNERPYHPLFRLYDVAGANDVPHQSTKADRIRNMCRNRGNHIFLSSIQRERAYCLSVS